MNYLKYIEHAAENLQFFLWHRDYTKRFNELPESERALSPEWTLAQVEAEALATQTQGRQKKLSPTAAAVFKGTDFDSTVKVSEVEKSNPFYTPPRTPSGEDKRDEFMSFDGSNRDSLYLSSKQNHVKKAEGAFDDAGLKWQPRR